MKRGKNGKVGDRGIPMMFVGMAENHAGDCHRMYNPATSKITETRDMIRLHRMFYQDNIDGEAALLPEIRVDVPELANVDPEVTAQLSQGKREPGGTDPV